MTIAYGNICGVDVGLVDTPGFDDTTRTDTEVLRDVCNWLADAFVRFSYRVPALAHFRLSKQHGAKIVGVIYLHRITDPRMGGVATKIMRLFRKICGDDALSHVILCTTRWDEVALEDGERREKNLRKDFWAAMLEHGSVLERHDNTPASALRILARVMKHSGIDLKVQEEMCDDGKTFEETSAAHSTLR